MTGRRARTYAAILVGGFFGGVLRVVLDEGFRTPVPQFPWTILAVNIVGSFALVLLMVLVTELWTTGALVRPLWGTGFLGAFTTFSAYVLAVIQLANAGAWSTAVGYGVGSIAGGLAAGALGFVLGHRVVTARTARSYRQEEE